MTGDTLLTIVYQGQSLSTAVVAAAIWAASSGALGTRAQGYGYTLTSSTVTAGAPSTGVQTFQTLAGAEAWIDQTATQNGQSSQAPSAQTQTNVVVTTPAKLPTVMLVGIGAGFLLGGWSALQAKEPAGKVLLDTGIGAVTGAAIGQLIAVLMQDGA